MSKSIKEIQDRINDLQYLIDHDTEMGNDYLVQQNIIKKRMLEWVLT